MRRSLFAHLPTALSAASHCSRTVRALRSLVTSDVIQSCVVCSPHDQVAKYLFSGTVLTDRLNAAFGLSQYIESAYAVFRGGWHGLAIK